MLDLLYVVDEIRRGDGAIQPPPEAPTEVVPWAVPPTPEQAIQRPGRSVWMMINPRTSRQTDKKLAPLSFTGGTNWSNVIKEADIGTVMDFINAGACPV
jgi:hypothetical protein